jgi:PAS domain S-box-containing protein
MNSKKVLIVEDERIVAVDIRRTLMSCGYTISGIASNAKEALEKFKQLRPDLVLMDILLGNKDDGIETAEKIIEIKDVPIIFLTAFADDETLERAKTINPFGYIIKPFEERELQAAMAMAFYRQEMESALVKSEQKYRSLVEKIDEGIVTLDENDIVTFANSAAAQIFQFQSGEELLDKNLNEFLDEENKRITLAESEKRKQGKSSKYELEIINNEGKKRVINVTSTPKFTDEAYHGSFNVLSDITDHKKIETALEKKTKQQEKLLESAKHLTTFLDVNQVLEQIGSIAKEILNAFSCAIYLVDELTNSLKPVVVIDLQYKDEILSTPLDIHKSFTGQAILQQKALIFNDAGTSKDGQYIDGTEEDPEEMLLVAPLLMEMDVLGVMSLIRKGVPFTEDDLQLLQAYANFAASALKNAQIHRALRKEMEFRKNAQEKLRETQFRLATIFKNVPNIILYERGQSNRFYSENIYDLIGVSAEELVKNTNKFTSLIHPDDNKILQKKLQQWNENGNYGMLTTWFRIRKIDGSYLWVEDRMVKIHKSSGESYIAGVMIDNTNLKQVEEELRKSESRYKAVVEDQTELISRYLPNKMLTFANDAYCRFFQKRRHEVIGKEWTKLLPAETASLVNEKISQLSRQNPSVTFEYQIPSQNGAIRWLETKERAIFDGDVVYEIQSVCRDITDRKVAELEKDEMQLQLMQTQKMETIGRLAGGIAHDFNNLVMAIISYANKIRKKTPPNSSIAEDLEVIYGCGQKAAQLTQQLLGFSRKQIVKPKLLNINEPITELLSMLQRLIKKEIKLELNLQPELKQVLIDPLQLEQILINLIMNANDAIENSGKITISTKNEQIKNKLATYSHTIDSGEYVVISIKDDGTGISAENLKHLFEPFFTTKEPGKGTGLGLATVYGICRQNMGFINVFSKVNEGTEFVLYLPVATSMEKKEVFAIKEQTKKPSLTESILLVEDDDNIRDFIVEIIEEIGYDVVEAANGGEALETIDKSAHFDLLITDVNMPNITGKDVAKKFLKSYISGKVLYISGYTEDPEIRENIKQASAHFLHKPFSYQQLIDKIQAILSVE